MKFFITHYTPLYDRKEFILKQLEHFNITNFEFVECHDREKLTEIEINKFKNTGLPAVSLFYKHVEIWKKQLNDIVIVLEDDAILSDNFMDDLDVFLKHLKETDWDVIFSGGCSNIHFEKQGDQIFYRSNRSRGTCMYILNKHMSKLLYDMFDNSSYIDTAVDHWFNQINVDNKLKYFLSEPCLVEQGSETKLFESTIR